MVQLGGNQQAYINKRKSLFQLKTFTKKDTQLTVSFLIL